MFEFRVWKRETTGCLHLATPMNTRTGCEHLKAYLSWVEDMPLSAWLTHPKRCRNCERALLAGVRPLGLARRSVRVHCEHCGHHGPGEPGTRLCKQCADAGHRPGRSTCPGCQFARGLQKHKRAWRKA